MTLIFATLWGVFLFNEIPSYLTILGATIIPVDIDQKTLNIDINALEEIVKKNNVKVVIFVDVAGLPNDIDSLVELSKKYYFTSCLSNSS